MGAREGGRRVRSPERDGLPCQTHILDQERGQGGLGRTGGLYRGQRRGKERRDKGNIREKREKREVSGEETWQRRGGGSS